MSVESLIDIVAGARPNFMKIAPIVKAIQLRQQSGSRLRYRIVHTGQHYDARMSGDFFVQLGIPLPDINLEVGSGTQAEQTSAIMTRYEKLLLEERPGLCVVVGDVTSTMACSIAAKKLRVKVGHVEGGIRSGDWTMPEEINRIVTDSITDYFFTTSQFANDNLRKSGVANDRVFFVGNTMIDTLLTNMPRIRPPVFWRELGLSPGEYFVATLHRPANVDNAEKLTALLNAIGEGCRDRPVIVPTHPRTEKTLRSAKGIALNIKLVEPQPYLEFIFLAKHARAVLTDSGGITEETTVMGIPCLTLRSTTERPETVVLGTNELIGTEPGGIKPALDRVFAGRWKTGSVPENWDGKTGERIVAVLEQLSNAAAFQC